jgi:hypothetical protein
VLPAVTTKARIEPSEPASGAQVGNPRHDAPYVYVYCAVRGSVNARAVGKLPALPDASPPRVLPLTRDISLIVADVPADVYRAESVESRLSDLDWVGRCGSAHHAVADALVSKHTVAPLRPFTLFSSEARARDTFGRLTTKLETALERVSGKAEWVLRIGPPDAARATADARVPPKPQAPTSGTSFLAQKAAARKSAGELAARVQREAARVFQLLATAAAQSQERPSESPAGLLLDATFLVPARQTASFKRVLEREAGALLRDGCHVSLTGPWPAYSFVSLETGSKRG